MAEFDESGDEVDDVDDDVGSEVAETCAVGALAFSAVAGLDFPDELLDDVGEFDPGVQEIEPTNRVLAVSDDAGEVVDFDDPDETLVPDEADETDDLLVETDDAPPESPLPGAASPDAVDEVLDSMTYDELVEAREQLVVSKETAEYENIIDGVNPNFDPNVDNAYARNCGGCAFSTWERLSGIDPAAQADWRNIGTIGGMEQACDMHFEESTPEQIEQFARSQGPGWHGMCAMQWPPDGETGHWVNLATSETGHVYVLDSQCGEVSLLRDYVEQNPAIRYHVNVK